MSMTMSFTRGAFVPNVQSEGRRSSDTRLEPRRSSAVPCSRLLFGAKAAFICCVTALPLD